MRTTGGRAQCRYPLERWRSWARSRVPCRWRRRCSPISRDELIRVFRKACTDAGIEDLKFQDLRHEAISRICERLPMQEAMHVVGYKTPAMIMRYYPSAAEDV